MTDGEACASCLKPRWACVCDRVASLVTRTRVLILQHPQEDDVVLGTARLLTTSLPSAKLAVGLSWPSLEAALGASGSGEGEVDRARWASVWVHDVPEGAPRDAAIVRMDRKGSLVAKGAPLDGVVLLDGTWSQAKTLWWRNPWLLKLGRVAVRPREPSIYGRMRKEPGPTHVSTLEAAADVLDALGEDAAVRAQLRKLMRTMVQRVRDHDAKPR